MKKNYVAITGDLVKSREIPHRSKVQTKLQKALNRINQQFKDDIVVKFSITLGDEFQCMLSSAEKSFDIIKEIQKVMYPVKISFGVGSGSISTKIAKKTSEMDGECFSKSRDALQKAKDTNQSVVFITGDKKRDLAINVIIGLIDTIKSRWKNAHYRRVWLYEELGTQEGVSARERISQAMMSKLLKNIGYWQIKKSEDVIIGLLKLTI